MEESNRIMARVSSSLGAILVAIALAFSTLPWGIAAAQPASETAFLFVYIPDRVNVEFSTAFNLRRFFEMAEYDEEENAFVGNICVTWSTEARLGFASLTAEHPITILYDGREIAALARVFAPGETLQEAREMAGDGDLHLDESSVEPTLCPAGATPVRLAIYLPQDFRDFDRTLLSGTMELFVRPI